MSVRRTARLRDSACLAVAAISLFATTAKARPPAYQPVVLYPSSDYVHNVAPTANGVVTLSNYGVYTVSGMAVPRGPDPSFSDCNVFAASGNQVGGDFNLTPPWTGMPSVWHAGLWIDLTQPPIDLHPTQFSQFPESQIIGAAGQQQVGTAWNKTTAHAMLWTGTAASAVDLNPAGFTSSYANGTDGIHQVGSGVSDQPGLSGALLWRGTADSAVSLEPTRLPFIKGSQAVGVFGNQQVGYGSWVNNGSYEHALLWNGTADSAVDLNPTGYWGSQAVATNGNLQVGNGVQTGRDSDNALVWSGSAGSAVDLQALLPTNFHASEAYSVDAAGNVYGNGWAFQSSANDYLGFYAIEWVAVPEPAALMLLVMCAPAMLLRRRCRQ